MSSGKQYRVLSIFFRGLRGENLSVKKLAQEYNISTKSITRSLNELKCFLAEHRQLVGNAELQYSHRERCYHLYMDEFLTNKEMFAMLEVLIGARAFSKNELTALIYKIKRFTSAEDSVKIDEMICKELLHYSEIKHDCKSVQDVLWQVITCVTERKEITIEYSRADTRWVTHRIRPVSVIFADHYFYLIAFNTQELFEKPLYFRIDRIKQIIEHRTKFTSSDVPEFDEGLLRKRSVFMWPGQLRTIRFEFNGSAISAILDKLPTAKIISRNGNIYTIEAEIYGEGIKMWLLSQGHRIRVLSPADFVEEMKSEVERMHALYS